MKDIIHIQGGIASDERGDIRFINDFDMSLVKRFYIIRNRDIDLIRGWRGHRSEQRWFYALSGSFRVDVVKIDDWESPDRELFVFKIELDSSEMKVLNLPAGYGTAIRALEPNSELLVFADHPISNAVFDDYVWPVDYFKNYI
ncbi:WxcM-like domain-containing protein [Sphingobacterium siyangense]|uniref:WxcM-like domain-containing protein n=1 Tax=Sphingobacterium siyangense TaxID=459529 RepID=UPI003DA4AED8